MMLYEYNRPRAQCLPTSNYYLISSTEVNHCHRQSSPPAHLAEAIAPQAWKEGVWNFTRPQKMQMLLPDELAVN